MIGDKPYYLPINQYVAWKVTKNEESEAVNKEEIEYKVNYRLFRLNGKSKRTTATENYLENLTKKLISKEKIVPMIVANKVQDDFLEEERQSINRSRALAKTVGESISPLLLPEDG